MFSMITLPPFADVSLRMVRKRRSPELLMYSRLVQSSVMVLSAFSISGVISFWAFTAVVVALDLYSEKKDPAA